MLENIPAELKALRQFVLWKYVTQDNGKPTKPPYQSNGDKANVNDPNTWNSFDNVISVLNDNGFNFAGIGFVLTINDPYAVIDLDKPANDKITATQLKIYNAFDSYSEISPSEEGLHVIVKGSVPSGARKNNVEIYSSQRYITMTGNVYNDKPIEERQELLTHLWNEIKKEPKNENAHNVEGIEIYNDDEIIRQAATATNGNTFILLHAGTWVGTYKSQSEADFAYIDILAFFTKNKNQIIRIFHNSPLGKRTKAKRKDYLDGMLNKAFDNVLPSVNTEGFKEALEAKIATTNTIAGSSNGKTAPFEGENIGSNPIPATTPPPLPPGLLGEIARFIYAAAPRPVPEIALAAAIGLMAGICGRAYNVSGTGLNHYVLLLAPTGTGKEQMASGIDRLMSYVTKTVPAASEFIGPSEIASGQALIKFLSKPNQNCFVSLLGEFGIRLETMSHQNASAADRVLKRVLLDLFNKSGKGQIFRPTIFADVEKNTSQCEAPAFSILGESTPERFYGALSEEMITEGLLPRFFIIEYNGTRPPLSENHLQIEPSQNLVEQVGGLAAYVKSLMHNRITVTIDMDKSAFVLSNRFDKHCDNQINSSSNEVVRQLWNRAHIKSLKLASLVAVGVNMTHPCITEDNYLWATELVECDIKSMTSRFEKGETGKQNTETAQVKALVKIIQQYVTKDWEGVKGYMAGQPQALHYAKVIPYVYVNKRLSNTATFNDGKQKASLNIKNALQVLIDTDKIVELPKQQSEKLYQCSQRVFMIKSASLMDPF